MLITFLSLDLGSWCFTCNFPMIQLTLGDAYITYISHNVFVSVSKKALKAYNVPIFWVRTLIFCIELSNESYSFQLVCRSCLRRRRPRSYRGTSSGDNPTRSLWTQGRLKTTGQSTVILIMMVTVILGETFKKVIRTTKSETPPPAYPVVVQLLLLLENKI